MGDVLSVQVPVVAVRVRSGSRTPLMAGGEERFEADRGALPPGLCLKAGADDV